MLRRIVRCVALPTLVLALVACSDDDESSDTTAAGPDASLIDPATTTAGDPATTVAGGGTATGMVAGTPDPCPLLSAAGVAAVLGEPAPGGTTTIEAEPPLNLRQCEWSVEPSDTSLRAIYLAVQTSEGYRLGGVGGGAYGVSDQYEATRSGLPQAVDVTGLGDAAFFTDASNHELQVLVGDTLLGISSQTIGSDAAPITGDQLRALMEEAMAAL